MNFGICRWEPGPSAADDLAPLCPAAISTMLRPDATEVSSANSVATPIAQCSRSRVKLWPVDHGSACGLSGTRPTASGNLARRGA